MNEKIKIFLAFLLVWSSVKAILFVISSISDCRKYIGNVKEFFKFILLTFLGIIAYPFSTLLEEWLVFLILTFLYFLFGGGIITFIVLVVLSLLITKLPLIIIFCTRSKNERN